MEKRILGLGTGGREVQRQLITIFEEGRIDADELVSLTTGLFKSTFPHSGYRDDPIINRSAMQAIVSGLNGGRPLALDDAEPEAAYSPPSIEVARLLMDFGDDLALTCAATMTNTGQLAVIITKLPPGIAAVSDPAYLLSVCLKLKLAEAKMADTRFVLVIQREGETVDQALARGLNPHTVTAHVDLAEVATQAAEQGRAPMPDDAMVLPSHELRAGDTVLMEWRSEDSEEPPPAFEHTLAYRVDCVVQTISRLRAGEPIGLVNLTLSVAPGGTPIILVGRGYRWRVTNRPVWIDA